MGSSCGKGEQGEYSDQIPEYASDNQFTNDPCVADQFSISLHSFSTTTNRLFTKRSSLTRGCKSVIVTQIKLEQNEPVPRKFAKTSSLLHMPVIRLSEMDVRLQLPELLPLNLFSGTQTIFSFIYPDTPEQSFVTLTGKIGTKPISMQKQITKNQILTPEEITQLGKSLDLEMDRYKKNNRKDRSDVRLIETPDASSNAETSYSGLGFVDESTDSDKEKIKKQTREKRSKMRRKDTPSHHNVSQAQRRLSRGSYRLKQNRQFLEGGSLQEEAEYLASDGEEYTQSASVDMGSGDASKDSKSDIEPINKPRRPDLLSIEALPLLKKNPQTSTLPLRVTRSFSNMNELVEEDSDKMNYSPISLKFESTTQPTKRKKQSIGSRLSKLSYQGMKPSSVQTLPDIKKALTPKDIDLDNDADDECECVGDDVKKRKDKLMKIDNKVVPTVQTSESQQVGIDLKSSLAVAQDIETAKENKESHKLIESTKDVATEQKTLSSKLDISKIVPVQPIKVLNILSPKSTIENSGSNLIREGRVRLKSLSESENKSSKTISDNLIHTELMKPMPYKSKSGEAKPNIEVKNLKTDSSIQKFPKIELKSKSLNQVTTEKNVTKSDKAVDDPGRKRDRSNTISMPENPRRNLQQKRMASLEEKNMPSLYKTRERSPVEAFIETKETSDIVSDK